MALDFESLGINKLTVLERLDLIEQILNSLPQAVEPEGVPEWHLQELAGRRLDAKNHPHEGRPWREVLALLDDRCQEVQDG